MTVTATAAAPDLHALVSRCTERLVLHFFGVDVELRCTPADLDDARFFYGRHAVTRARAAERVEVYLDGEGGFFRSLLAKDQAAKRIATREDDGPLQLLADFRRWSGAPSPVPPFASRALQRLVVVTRGTVVRAPDGRAVCIIGDNYIGKTTTALALMERGWHLLSDHLLILRRDGGQAEPYLSPLGLRRETLRALEARGALAGKPRRETVSEVTGRVVLIHPWDLFPPADGTAALPAAAAVGRLVYLLRRDDGPPRVLGWADTPRMAAYPAGGHDTLAAYLPRRCVLLGLPARHTPADVATALTRALHWSEDS